MVRLLALAAPLALAAALAAPAAADTFCVHQGTGCPPGATDEGADLQEALDDATAVNGPDVVTIGPGTYAGPFEYADSDPLEIEGTKNKTRLTAPGGPAGVVLASGVADVSKLYVQIPPGDGWTGVTASQTALLKLVRAVSEAGAATNRIGFALRDEAQVKESGAHVDGPGGVGAVLYPGEHFIRDSFFSGPVGIRVLPSAQPASLIRRTHFSSATSLQVINASLTIDNSLLAGAITGVDAQCGPGAQPSVVRGHHLTILGGTGGSAGIRSACAIPGRAAGIELDHAIVRGFEQAFERTGANGGQADLAIEWSDLQNVAGSLDAGPGSATLTSIVDVDPLFGSNAHSLYTGSPLIDAGEPGPAMQALDFDEGPRLIGDAQDIGADEYDPADPPNPPLGPGAGGQQPGAGAGAGQPADSSAAGGGGASTVPGTRVTGADLLAELRRTLARRRGRTYRHRFLVPGTLRIKWAAGSRVVAQLRVQRSRTGVAKVRIKATRRGRRMLRSVRRVRVYGSFAPTGGRAVRATRRARLRRG